MFYSYNFSVYLIRNYFFNFITTILLFLSLSAIVDISEMLRKTADKAINFNDILQIAIYKLPFTLQTIFPFIVILTANYTYTKLNKNNELIAARSAGISAWQFILPTSIFIFIISAIFIIFANPFVAASLQKSNQLENKTFYNKDNFVTISDQGIWLKDIDMSGKLEKIIYAKSLYEMGKFLSEVSIFIATENNDFSYRIEADIATINNGKIILSDTQTFLPGKENINNKQIKLTTNLIPEQLQDNLKDPQIIGFWDLKNFIKLVETSGFSSLKYQMQYYNLLFLPLFLAGLNLLSSSLSLTIPRKGKLGLMMFVTTSLGFFIFFLTKIINVMGLSGSINVLLGATAPILICLLSAIFLIFHLEDG